MVFKNMLLIYHPSKIAHHSILLLAMLCTNNTLDLITTQVIQNAAGPIYEETLTPAPPRINSALVYGELSEITLEWLNDNQLSGEEYTIWKNYGNPFGENEDQVSLVSPDNGWVIHDASIVDTGSTFTEFKFTETYQIPSNVESQYGMLSLSRTTLVMRI